MNGCIDVIDELEGDLLFKYNNTYNLHTINSTQYHDAVSNFNGPGGCKDALSRSRSVAAQYDPTNQGGNDSVNALFNDGTNSPCNAPVFDPGFKGRNWLDIAGPTQSMSPLLSSPSKEFTGFGLMLIDPFPPPYFYGFLAQKWVLDAIGVPVNYTDMVQSIDEAFGRTGDYSRGGYAEALERVLDNGGKVALVFGDRDAVSIQQNVFLLIDIYISNPFTRPAPGPAAMP